MCGGLARAGVGAMRGAASAVDQPQATHRATKTPVAFRRLTKTPLEAPGLRGSLAYGKLSEFTLGVVGS